MVKADSVVKLSNSKAKDIYLVTRIIIFRKSQIDVQF